LSLICKGNYRQQLILAARWHTRLDVTSPLDSPIPIFYKWFTDIYRIGDDFRVICENVNFAARWRFRPQVTLPLDSPISCKWSIDIMCIFIRPKVLYTFWFLAGKFPLRGIIVKIASTDWILTFFNFVSYSACRAASIQLQFLWIGYIVNKLCNGIFWLGHSLWGSFY
jgi:hypothetical protein